MTVKKRQHAKFSVRFPQQFDTLINDSQVQSQMQKYQNLIVTKYARISVIMPFINIMQGESYHHEILYCNSTLERRLYREKHNQ